MFVQSERTKQKAERGERGRTSKCSSLSLARVAGVALSSLHPLHPLSLEISILEGKKKRTPRIQEPKDLPTGNEDRGTVERKNNGTMDGWMDEWMNER